MQTRLNSLGVVDAVVVVTRYFGGIKLGVGGLSRAYGSAAKGEQQYLMITFSLS